MPSPFTQRLKDVENALTVAFERAIRQSEPGTVRILALVPGHHVPSRGAVARTAI